MCNCVIMAVHKLFNMGLNLPKEGGNDEPDYS